MQCGVIIPYMEFEGAQMILPAHGRAGQRQLLNSFAAYFAKRNTNLGGGESEGGTDRVDSSPCGWNPSLNRT